MPEINCQRFAVGPAGARTLQAALAIAKDADRNLTNNHDALLRLLRSRGGSPTAFVCAGFTSIRVAWYPLSNGAMAACLIRRGKVERLDLFLYGNDTASTARQSLREMVGFDLPPQANALSGKDGYVTHATFLFWREPENCEESTDVLALIALVPTFCDLLEIPLANPQDDIPPPLVEQAPFINSSERANWIVRKIAEHRAYGERVRLWAAKEQMRAEREEKRLLYLFGRQLEDWVRNELATFNGRRKSINYPAGVVGFHRVPAKLVIEDSAAVMEWARQNCPEAIVTEEHLSRETINAHAKATGEIPDKGAKIQPERETFFVR